MKPKSRSEKDGELGGSWVWREAPRRAPAKGCHSTFPQQTAGAQARPYRGKPGSGKGGPWAWASAPLHAGCGKGWGRFD